MERKRKRLPIISGSEWRLYKSPAEVEAEVDRMIAQQEFRAQQKSRLDKSFERFFLSPDFAPSKTTVRARLFQEAAAEWDFDNPGSEAAP